MDRSTNVKGNPTLSLDEQLRFAIANRRLVRITYDAALRVGEPHDYGIQGGISKLLFYQLRRASGDHQWQVAPGWRGLVTSKIETCEVLQETFRGTRASSHQQHLPWDELFARVK